MNLIMAYLSSCPDSADILLFRLSQQKSCNLQKPCFLQGLPNRREACFYCLRSNGESCPVRAKTRRSDYRSHVCSHPSHGRNLQSRPFFSEKPSNLHRLLSDHRTLQIHPNHQDRLCTLHLTFYQNDRFLRSSCKLKVEENGEVRFVHLERNQLHYHYILTNNRS